MLQVGCVYRSVGIGGVVGSNALALALNLNDPGLEACRVCTRASVAWCLRVMVS